MDIANNCSELHSVCQIGKSILEYSTAFVVPKLNNLSFRGDIC